MILAALLSLLPMGAAAQDDTAAGGRDSGGQTAASAPAVPANQIDQSQLVGLPLNGRSYSQLATLEAGVSDPSAASGSRGVGGGSLTVAGGRSASNVFLLDGTNIMDARNQVPRSAAGVQLGSDAVIEVQVFSTNYGPEYGRGSGGILNSITKSGTPGVPRDVLRVSAQQQSRREKLFSIRRTNPSRPSSATNSGLRLRARSRGTGLS